MEVLIKAKLPPNDTGFLVGEIKVKIRSLKWLEESIDYNKGYILLNIVRGDNGNYLMVNDYAGKKRTINK